MVQGDHGNKLTRLESSGLQARWNLCDAHTHQKPTSAESAAIIDNLSALFMRSSQIEQAQTDAHIVTSYHQLAGQRPSIEITYPLLCYSSSQAFEIACNLLRLERLKRVALYEPTFDNIPDILRRHGMTLTPLDVMGCWIDELHHLVQESQIDAAVLVVPNNPTGEVISQAELEDISRLLAAHGILLIIDASFRLFDDRACFDFYSILLASGVSFIVIEDTGKVWPTLDLKLAFVNCSRDLWEGSYSIHQDFLLNVSPFVNLLVAEFCRISSEDNLLNVRSLIADNRATAREVFYDPGLCRCVNRDSRVSVELIQVRNGHSATEIADYINDTRGVSVLPGTRFFWSNQQPNADSFLRLALSRDRNYFKSGATRAAEAMTEWYGGSNNA
jgi:aspartate/methionine/tyrosine aminotransferase